MTPKEREDFYDREIAPILLDLANKCAENGLSFVAMAEWDAGETGRTMKVREDAGIGIKMALWAMQATGNADNLIWAMQRHGKAHGHNSICLHMLEQPPRS